MSARSRLCFVSLALLFSVATQAQGQNPPPPRPTWPLTIVNSFDHSITVGVKMRGGSWDYREIPVGYTQTFNVSGVVDVGIRTFDSQYYEGQFDSDKLVNGSTVAVSNYTLQMRWGFYIKNPVLGNDEFYWRRDYPTHATFHMQVNPEGIELSRDQLVRNDLPIVPPRPRTPPAPPAPPPPRAIFRP